MQEGEQSGTPQEIPPREDDVRMIVLQSLRRLRTTPETLKASPGHASLATLASEVQNYLFTPHIPGQEAPPRIVIAPVAAEYLRYPSRMVIGGNSRENLHFSIQLNHVIFQTFDQPTTDSILVPYIALAARFLRAANAVELDQPDITFADRLSVVYQEAYTLQRLYMQHMNEHRKKGTPAFFEAPTPQAVVQKVEQTLFGNPPRFPIDFGIQDFIVAFEGPKDVAISENPNRLQVLFDAKRLAHNPKEQQRFLSAFSLYLTKVLPPDSMDEALLRKAIIEDAAWWSQADDVREAFAAIREYPLPLLEFVFYRAQFYQLMLNIIYTAYQRERTQLHLPQRQLNAQLFSPLNAAQYGVISLATILLEDGEQNAEMHDANLG